MNPLVATTARRAYGSWVGGVYTHEQDTVDFTSPKTRSFIIVRLNSRQISLLRLQVTWLKLTDSIST